MSTLKLSAAAKSTTLAAAALLAGCASPPSAKLEAVFKEACNTRSSLTVTERVPLNGAVAPPFLKSSGTIVGQDSYAHRIYSEKIAKSGASYVTKTRQTIERMSDGKVLVEYVNFYIATESAGFPPIGRNCPKLTDGSDDKTPIEAVFFVNK